MKMNNRFIYGILSIVLVKVLSVSDSKGLDVDYTTPPEREPYAENEYAEPDYSAENDTFAGTGGFTDQDNMATPHTWDADIPAAPAAGTGNHRQKAPAGKEKKDYGHGILK